MCGSTGPCGGGELGQHSGRQGPLHPAACSAGGPASEPRASGGASHTRGPRLRDGEPACPLAGKAFHSTPGRQMNTTSSTVRRREEDVNLARLCPRPTSGHSRNSPWGQGHQGPKQPYHLHRPHDLGPKPPPQPEVPAAKQLSGLAGRAGRGGPRKTPAQHPPRSSSFSRPGPCMKVGAAPLPQPAALPYSALCHHSTLWGSPTLRKGAPLSPAPGRRAALAPALHSGNEQPQGQTGDLQGQACQGSAAATLGKLRGAWTLLPGRGVAWPIAHGPTAVSRHLAASGGSTSRKSFLNCNFL